MAKDITLGNPNVSTGAFNFVRGSDGDVSFDTTGAHGVMTSAIERKGSNPFDATHGSDLYLLRSNTSRTPSEAESEVLEAEQPLELAGEIQDVLVEASGSGSRLTLDVTWKSGTGEQQSQTIEV